MQIKPYMLYVTLQYEKLLSVQEEYANEFCNRKVQFLISYV